MQNKKYIKRGFCIVAVALLLFAGKTVISEVNHPEEARNIKEHPEQVMIQGAQQAEVSPVEHTLLQQLHMAKTSGNMPLIRFLEERLRVIRHEPNNPAEPLVSGEPHDEPHIKAMTSVLVDDIGTKIGSDVLVAGTLEDEVKPSMTSDTSGNLYIAVEYAGTSNKYIDIYRSTTDGASWSYWTGVTGTSDCMNPSLAVGEGEENWLFLAFNYGENNIYVFRFNLSNPGVYTSSSIQSNALGVSNPRMVTDSSEYFYSWYPYLIYNAGSLAKQDLWTLKFTRSLDYGVSWETPTTIADYSEDDFYDASDAHPDIDYGGFTLYVAFDDFPPTGWGPNRDIYVMSSSDYGSSWSSITQVTTDSKDEYDPVVAVVKNSSPFPMNSTALVAYTYEYTIWDNDIYYAYTQDEGSSWSSNHILVNTVMDEKNPEVTTSYSEGALHIAYWHDYDVDYARADYTTPSVWTFHPQINDVSTVSSVYTRPSLAVNPTQLVSQEAGICWTDFRNGGTANDIYFDSLLPPPNHPPYTPSEPSPFDGATGVDINAELSWVGGDPDVNDTVTYDVYFGTSSPPPQVVWGQLDTTYDPGAMQHSTQYFWKVVAWDNHGEPAEGPVWSFTTEAAVNNPPYDPTEPIPADGSTGVDVDDDLFWCGGDPDPGDMVTYDLYFGTTSPPPQMVWNQSGTSYDPGTMMDGTQYYWQVIAWDNHHASTAGPIWTFFTEYEILMPDLIITDIWHQDDIICYQVRNIGTGNASSSHDTALFIDGAYIISDSVPVELAPSERWNGCFNHSWACTPLSDSIDVRADYGNSIAESNETNNRRVEEWSCDGLPPEIITGPVVHTITQDSAVVYWETDEESDSLVLYGSAAGDPALEVTNESLVFDHYVPLVGLEPSTTYHGFVRSADLTGNRVESTEVFFETLPEPDEIPPTVTVQEPGVCTEYVLISAEAEDNKGVEKVVFYINDLPVFTDFSAPYQYGWDTTACANGPYEVGSSVSDLIGHTSYNSAPATVANLIDETYPEVRIVYPHPGQTLSQNVHITAFLEDDVDLMGVSCYIDGVLLIYKPYPEIVTYTGFAYQWDTYEVENGKHRIGIRARDSDGKPTLRCVDVYVDNPPKPQPNLIVTDHVITQHINGVAVDLMIKNVGNAVAKNIHIVDNFQAFQPISCTYLGVEYAAKFNAQTIRSDCDIWDLNEEIYPGVTKMYTIRLIPILHYAIGKLPMVGGSQIQLFYKNSAGEDFSKPIDFAIDQHTVQTVYDAALKTADYLIVTNPYTLFMDHVSRAYDDPSVDRLLSTMAELAWGEKRGVLGYFDYNCAGSVNNGGMSLEGLIGPNYLWGKKLSPNFRTAQRGYLLIVGETEIIGAWTEHADITVADSDHRYADTCDNIDPELNVGRIIGNTPDDLYHAILSSIDGFPFKRDTALLISGTGGGQSEFVKNVEDVKDIIKNDFSCDILHWKDYGTIGERFTEFLNRAGNRDVIFYRDHGNVDTWDNTVNTSNVFQVNFGSVNPFVFASACVTGNYERDDDENIAEAFFDEGTAVYIGATENSDRGANNKANKIFFNKWKPTTTIGQAFAATKDKLDASNKQEKRWIYEYNLYGDPKFGILNTRAEDEPVREVNRGSRAQVDVVVPDYQVTTVEGIDYIEIPNGSILLEEGRPQIPYYIVEYDYDVGYRIQDVVLMSRTSESTEENLTLPITILGEDVSPGQTRSENGLGEEWYPSEIDTWAASINPDGTTTVQINLYPFYYNQQTAEAIFYQNYSFDIVATVSEITMTAVTLESAVYHPGDIVRVNLTIDNQGEAQDVILAATVGLYGSDDILEGLPLVSLSNFSGLASCTLEWDSTGYTAGTYCFTLVLMDFAHTLLDRQTITCTVGIPFGEITWFSVSPQYFDIGDLIEIEMNFTNTGTEVLSGTTYTFVKDIQGDPLLQFTHVFAEVQPLESTSHLDVWDTSAAENGSYVIVSSVVYNTISTAPVGQLISTNHPPVAQFVFSPDPPVLIGQPVLFDSSGSVDPDGSIVSWEWAFGDGNMSTEQTPVQIYLHPGNYTVSLTVCDNEGAISTTSSYITVREVNAYPFIFNENPAYTALGVPRPPAALSALVEDPDGDSMDVYIRWNTSTGDWVTLQSFQGVSNGTYTFVPPIGNDWIWGNTTYTWSVNATDGSHWTNDTYTYTTKGSRYDVNNNNIVNFQDAGLVWVHRTSIAPYDGLYDVNGNGVVNFQDAGLTWVNRE